MQEIFFSIIVVSLNPGGKLRETLESIEIQDFREFEVILKDGGSSDGSLEELETEGFFTAHPEIRIFREKDRGIYDAMNQAVKKAKGQYLQFLNCGDLFYDPRVLSRAAEAIGEKTDSGRPRIFYGNQFNRLQQSVVYSAPTMNDFTCYRNVPCHQVCFYSASLFAKRGYDVKYRVRADYEHFLYSIYREQAEGIYIPVLVASYEGGGFSETAENRKKSAAEHKEITLQYMGKRKVWKYRWILWLTLAPLRTKIAENPRLSGVYNKVKQRVYEFRK